MIVDAFTFFNEKELVELRVKYLNDIVDCFLVNFKKLVCRLQHTLE